MASSDTTEEPRWKDHRFVVCPLCGIRTCRGSLRAHLAAPRCMGRKGTMNIVWSEKQQTLADKVRDLDKALAEIGL